MEHWQIVIVIYCGIAFVWSLYTLFRYHKFQKSKNFKSEKNLIFVFFLVFLLVVMAMVAHVCYLMGSAVEAWPIFVSIGLMILGCIVPSIWKNRKNK